MKTQWKHLSVVAGFSAVLATVFLMDLADEAQAQAPNTEKKAKGAPNIKPKIKPKSTTVVGTTPGAGKKLDPLALAKIIDAEVNRKMKEEGYQPSRQADDAEFLRRVYLDLVGTIPSADKVKAFLDNTDAKKREKVIDELLASNRFGNFHAEVLTGLMIPRESNNRRLTNTPFLNWLADNLNKNTPLDKTVHELLTATGPQDKNGAVTYFIGNPTVDKMTDNVTRVFLGVQLQCAQCHNHPFTDWKQKEYWGMAQFFMKTKLTVNPQQAAKKGESPGITETAAAKGKKTPLPESAMKVNAKFLGDVEVNLKDSEPYRPILADWITSKSNPYFAKAMVNRWWYQMFGRGIVNPVDDMHENNDPSHPELLAALTEQFKASGFDNKYLLKAICNSDAYQRSSRPTADNKEDKKYLSHRVIRVQVPEQLYDSLATVLGRENKANEKGDRKAANKGMNTGAGRDGFVNFFKIEDGFDPLEYQNGIPQTLRIMNSSQTNLTRDAVNSATKLSGGDPAKTIEQLYLTGLSRRPTADETTRMVAYVTKASDRNTAYNDILWVMINSSEFALNH